MLSALLTTETIGEDHVAELTYGTAGGILSTTAGGLVVIEKSENHGTVEGMVSGGILGDAQSTVEISGCNNNGNIRGAFFVGGIIGDFWHNGGNGTISDCHNLKGAVVESHESFQTADGKPNDGTFGVRFNVQSHRTSYIRGDGGITTYNID